MTLDQFERQMHSLTKDGAMRKVELVVLCHMYRHKRHDGLTRSDFRMYPSLYDAFIKLMDIPIDREDQNYRNVFHYSGVNYSDELNMICRIDHHEFVIAEAGYEADVNRLKAQNFFDSMRQLEVDFKAVENYGKDEYANLLTLARQIIVNNEAYSNDKNCYNIDKEKVFDTMFDDKEEEEVSSSDCGFYDKFMRGYQKKELIVKSGASGFGKSRYLMKDALSIAIGRKWEGKNGTDMTEEDLEDLRKDFKGMLSFNNPKKTLFISTELSEEKLATMAVAILSGINEQVIVRKTYTDNQKILLETCRDLIKQSNIDFKFMSSYNAADIEKEIIDRQAKDGLEYVILDYIKSTPKLMAASGNVPEHKVLCNLAQDLERMCNAYNIGIISATQINMGEARGQAALSDSKAIAHAIHVGIQLISPNKEEIEMLKGFGFDTSKQIVGQYIYKNRKGRTDMFIWQEIDRGNMVVSKSMATDASGQGFVLRDGKVYPVKSNLF